MAGKVKYNTEHQRRLAISKQVNEYQKRATTLVALRFNNTKDKDILDKLDSVDNKVGYVKKLIRDDIEKSEGE